MKTGDATALSVVADHAYAERNKVVAALCRMALVLGWPAGVGQHEGANWEADWRTVVFIDLPTGQVSWHFHDSEKSLLYGMPSYPGKWDGHTTEQKYDRLHRMLNPAVGAVLSATAQATLWKVERQLLMDKLARLGDALAQAQAERDSLLASVKAMGSG